MKTRLVVYPFKMGSENGQKISKALDALRVYPDRNYHPQDGDFIVNWGNGHQPNWASELNKKNFTLLNNWNQVALSINKIDTLSVLADADVPVPHWTTSYAVAAKWLKAGDWVCCRQQVKGKDGEGLILAKKPAELVDAKLYTKYMEIHKEFRAYVFRDKLFDLREKRRDSEALAKGEVNEYIRTETNNWVFCQHNIVVPKDIESVAVGAVKALGLDFAGVDVIQSKANKLCYVLETNTAPYLGDVTAERLRDLIITEQKKFLNEGA